MSAAIFNPAPTFPFCPEQTDFLTFHGESGFIAVYLDLIEGFTAGMDERGVAYTIVQLTNDSSYTSVETVPELVSRFAAIKALRYSKERPDKEVVAAASPTVIVDRTRLTTDASGSVPGIWKK